MGKKKLGTMLVSVGLIGAMVAGGSLAYLTDRDSEVNVFTVGDVRIELNEEFEQGTKLTPGVDIDKKPTITNTGNNDAYVWMELAIPTALDHATDASKNVIHWNPLGATYEGLVSDSYVTGAFEKGWLTREMFPADVTNVTDYILSNNMTWDHNNTLANGTNKRTAKIADGKELASGDANYDTATEYSVYVIPYNKALKPGETTLPSLVKVYMDYHIDIDTNGDWFHVEKGEITDLNWNTKEDGAPLIYISAYAIQAEGFATVDDAYAAYASQWTTNSGVNKGAEWAEVINATPTSGATRPAGYEIQEVTGETTVIEGVTVLDGSDDKTNLRALYKEGGISESVEVKDSVFDGTYAMNLTTTAADKTLNFENTTFMGWVSYDGFKSVTFTDCTFKINSEATYNYLRAYDATVFENCEFAGTTLDITGDGSIKLKNCTYNGELIDSVDDLTLEEGVVTSRITIE